MSIRLVLGRTRTGKTTLARALVRDARRVVFVDPFPVPSAPTEVWTLEQADEIDWGAEELRVTWSGEPDYEFLETLDDIDLVIDDPDGGAWKGNQIRDIALRRIVTRHGHYGQRITIVTQRPSLLPPIVRTMASEVYCFCLTEPADRKYALEAWGLRPPGVPLEYASWIAHGHEAPADPFRARRGRKRLATSAPTLPPSASPSDDANPPSADDCEDSGEDSGEPS